MGEVDLLGNSPGLQTKHSSANSEKEHGSRGEVTDSLRGALALAGGAKAGPCPGQ